MTTIMHQLAIDTYKNNINNNQYLELHVVCGELKRVSIKNRLIRILSFGLSSLFTSKYIVVKGSRTEDNEKCLDRIKMLFDSETLIYDMLKSD